MTLLRSGQRIEASREYTVASWACTADAVEGPPIWDLVERYVARKKVVSAAPASVISGIER